MCVEKYITLIKDYAYNNYKKMFRGPDGNLKHKFIVPGSVYNNSLWDWDSWLTDIALRQILCDCGQENSIEEYEKGCILNFLEYTTPSGWTPYLLTPTRNTADETEEFETNMHKPCLAQHAAFILKNNEDCTWLEKYYDRLDRFVKSYMEHCRHESGLYFWIDDAGIGVDNDPCTFYRPKKSSASIYLNSLMYKELEAMVYISERLDYAENSVFYKNNMNDLKKAVNELCWDERDGFYYSADINLLPVNPESQLHRGCPRHWNTLIQRIGVWSGMMPMWAEIADKKQAERIVNENYQNTQTFNAPYGIRTLSKLEKMYTIRKSGNPSCWLGPIWGISNYMTFRALIKYGFEKQAKELAIKTIKLFGQDILKNGEMHEYYNPESGEGINNPGFQNWNFLVLNMIAHIEGKKTIEEF